MKIKLRTIYASAKRTAYPGEVLSVPKDISEEEAKQLIEGRFGVPVSSEIETAAMSPRRAERAARQPRFRE